MPRLPLLALAFLLPALPVRADILADCDGPTPVMTQCVWDRYAEADRELNDLWAEVLATIAGHDEMSEGDRRAWRESLTAAQRAWIAFKDQDCNGAVAYEWFGGTGANAAIGACLYDHTVDRINSLRARYLDN